MIIGIGTDILNLSRLYAFPPSRLNRLVTRILTTNEQELLRKRMLGSPFDTSTLNNATLSKNMGEDHAQRDILVNFLGVRWTAKEAVYKALYPHLKLSWKDVELLPVRNQPSPSTKLRAKFTKPTPVTLEDIECTLSTLKSHVSVSHDGKLVVAMVVVEGEA